MFNILAPLRTSYRAPRVGRAAERRYADTVRRLTEARQHDSEQPMGGGSVDTPARAARRAPARKPMRDADGDSDGDGPGRRRVAPLFYGLHDTAEALDLSTRAVQRLVQEGDFPKPRALSSRRVAWLVCEIEAWAVSRPIAAMLPPPSGVQ
jgi:prophage regulatory protein